MTLQDSLRHEAARAEANAEWIIRLLRRVFGVPPGTVSIDLMREAAMTIDAAEQRENVLMTRLNIADSMLIDAIDMGFDPRAKSNAAGIKEAHQRAIKERL